MEASKQSYEESQLTTLTRNCREGKGVESSKQNIGLEMANLNQYSLKNLYKASYQFRNTSEVKEKEKKPSFLTSMTREEKEAYFSVNIIILVTTEIRQQ
jgi:hypothetical protein